ncbi:DnaJ C-terminal domain-containing protein [Mycoplasmopsis opalescens]|uniref:DnaJ C-terminal domain-containing protein n=1 Tax=Mycoplasmopsis opalescens TaxID=114886 RepID=UPI000565CE66|nr:DnaJ C-terminal domain-containing protein [Mycoplasmopsis opalescens]
MKKDFYEILGVSKDATDAEIKAAYRKLAMEYHPDKLKDGSSDKKMQELNEAYEVLRDKTKRENYDRYGNPDGQQGFDFGGGAGDIFSNFFSGFSGFSDLFGGSSRTNNTPTKGRDYMMNKEISFMDSIMGREITEKLTKHELCDHCSGSGAESLNDIKTCSTCNGRGSVRQVVKTPFGQMETSSVCSKCYGQGKEITKKCSVCKGKQYLKKEKKVTFSIPEGVESGERKKIPGYGERGENGGPSGDLYVQFIVKEHKYYVRKGLNLYLDLPVSFIDIMSSKVVKVPTPYGEVSFKLKPEYQNDRSLVIPNKGVKKSGRQGDLVITLKVNIPNLSRLDKEKVLSVFENIHDSVNEDFTKNFKN